MNGLRLDRFLWFARLVKSRTLAQKLISSGCVRIDGQRVINDHVAVKIGQQLVLTFNQSLRVVQVLSLPSRRGPAEEAQSCYTEIVATRPIDGN